MPMQSSKAVMKYGNSVDTSTYPPASCIYFEFIKVEGGVYFVCILPGRATIFLSFFLLCEQRAPADLDFLACDIEGRCTHFVAYIRFMFFFLVFLENKITRSFFAETTLE